MRKISIVLLLLLLIAPAVIAQEEGEDNASLTVDEQIARIESNTEILRGLTPKEDIPVLFPSRDDVRAFLQGEFDEAYTPEVVAELMAFYVAFEFLPPDFDIQAAVLELYSQQVAGYYDPDTEAMHVVTNDGEPPVGRMLILDRITYSHEYVHALQDQYFDLDAYFADIEEIDNNDLAIAYQALVEGDATFVMNEYTRQVTEANPLGAMLELGVGALQAGNLTLPAGTPAIFEAELLFPYLSGEQFVRSLYAAGGWDTVNTAYSAPPQSTEQILHPQAYLDGDVPQSVDLPVSAPEGYELATSGTLGEFYLREWLDPLLTDEPIDIAATGWGGDTYNIYRNADNDLALDLRIVWDTPTDTVEFVEVFSAFAELRIPDATRPMGDVLCWSGDMTLCLNIVDETTVDITFAYNIEIANDLLN